MGLQWEFWILGELEKIVTYQEVQLDQYALTKAHVELFHMAPDHKIFKR
jgi:hypothetical protein